MLITKTRRWGNSLGLRIPKEVVKEMLLREDQDIAIEIIPQSSPLKDIFGFAKNKIKKSTEQILKEARRGLSKHF